jgi:hypothetical protein
MQESRRQFLKSAGALLFSVGGVELLLTPREARAQTASFRVFDQRQVGTLEALGEILVPGAAAAGIAYFVDSQLAADPNDCLLIARYFNLEPPYSGFYAGALASVERLSMRRHGKPFGALAESDAVALVRDISVRDPEGWEGPPAPLAYLLIRSDAVDVSYGTVEGFQRLNVPYMPHIPPPDRW